MNILLGMLRSRLCHYLDKLINKFRHLFYYVHMQVQINTLNLKGRIKIKWLIISLFDMNIAYMMGDWHGVKSGNT